MNKAYINLLIGGPGTGKSTTLKGLRDKGFKCFEEISRQVTLQAQKEGVDQLFLKQPLLFSEKLLEGRITQYKTALSLQETCFIDRGIPDITAYMDLFKEEYPQLFVDANKKYSYDFIFHFPVWEEIYEQDNERYENLEQAQKIDAQLIKTYKDLGYSIIEVPKTSIQERIDFIMKYI
ncbi:MAG: ATP-binding protein [Flavobacteriaceae bacterium]|nr:ATP-binding protein [Flavobacteriaceae bacterium]